MTPRVSGIVTILAGIALTAACRGAPPATRLLIDHDAGAEDLIAMAMVVNSAAGPAAAVTVAPADSFLEAAVPATRRVLELLGAGDVPVFAGHDEGINRFPDEWRQEAARVLALPSIRGVMPRGNPAAVAPATEDDAPHAIARLLASGGAWTILETGPLSNVAEALKIDPAIAAHITRVVVMGGAVRTKGNVDQPGHDGSAEWNLYNAPGAAAAVIEAGVPITLISLDATNQMPMSMAFVDRVAAQSAASSASRLAAEAWSLGEGQIRAGEYYFWDTLTAAALIDPSVVATTTVRVKIATSGASQGRIVEDASGMPIQVAFAVDRSRAERVVLAALK